MADPARFKLLRTPRREGKSNTDGRLLIQAAFETADCSVLYIGKTIGSARRTMVRHILVPLFREFGIKYEYNKTELSFTLENGSVIYLTGMDADEKQQNKVFGQKFKLAIVDEAALFRTDLRQIIYTLLVPAVLDERGTIIVSGMPSNLHQGFFYELTSAPDAQRPDIVYESLPPTSTGTWSVVDREYGTIWKGFYWAPLTNPYMREQKIEQTAILKATSPGIETTPDYQQSYLGVWAIDYSALVYRFNEERNTLPCLPVTWGNIILREDRWRYVLGIDLGWNDPTAFVVGAYHPDANLLIYVQATKESGLVYIDEARRRPDVKSRIEFLRMKYPIDTIIIDGAEKQGVETLSLAMKIPLVSTEKQGKWDFIDLMNGDFDTQVVRLLDNDTDHPTADLMDEYRKLVKDPNAKLLRHEHPGCSNHATDAALYIYRHVRSLVGHKAKPPPKFGSKAWFDQQTENAQRQAIGAARMEGGHGGSNPWGS